MIVQLKFLIFFKTYAAYLNNKQQLRDTLNCCCCFFFFIVEKLFILWALYNIDFRRFSFSSPPPPDPESITVCASFLWDQKHIKRKFYFMIFQMSTAIKNDYKCCSIIVIVCFEKPCTLVSDCVTSLVAYYFEFNLKENSNIKA